MCDSEKDLVENLKQAFDVAIHMEKNIPQVKEAHDNNFPSRDRLTLAQRLVRTKVPDLVTWRHLRRDISKGLFATISQIQKGSSSRIQSAAVSYKTNH